MVTIMTNRLGDFSLFYVIASVLVRRRVFHSLIDPVVVLAIIITAYTKSAITPFSGWLPKAIAAPTPVSALVHSSTLVTAGLVLLIRYSEL